MGDGLAALRAMEYPGRVIVIGRSLGGEWLVGYAVTGRSPSSRARRLVVRSDSNLYTEPIDPKLLASGNPALLVYPAIVRCKCGVVVSNGAQTTPVHERLCAEPGASAEQVLASALGDGRAGVAHDEAEPAISHGQLAARIAPRGAGLHGVEQQGVRGAAQLGHVHQRGQRAQS